MIWQKKVNLGHQCFDPLTNCFLTQAETAQRTLDINQLSRLGGELALRQHCQREKTEMVGGEQTAICIHSVFLLQMKHLAKSWQKGSPPKLTNSCCRGFWQYWNAAHTAGCYKQEVKGRWFAFVFALQRMLRQRQISQHSDPSRTFGPELRETSRKPNKDLRHQMGKAKAESQFNSPLLLSHPKGSLHGYPQLT